MIVSIPDLCTLTYFELSMIEESVFLITVPIKTNTHFSRYSTKQVSGKFAISRRNSAKQTEQRDISRVLREFKLACLQMYMGGDADTLFASLLREIKAAMV